MSVNREKIVEQALRAGCTPEQAKRIADSFEDENSPVPNRLVVWVSDLLLARLQVLADVPGATGIPDVVRGLLRDALNEIDAGWEKQGWKTSQSIAKTKLQKVKLAEMVEENEKALEQERATTGKRNLMREQWLKDAKALLEAGKEGTK